jgi:GGDEF domain-containing protein
LAEETKNLESDLGELRFEFFEKGEDDADKKFTGSVKNLLVLIKDFYGADGTAVYWFNKSKQRFKILAASEDGRIGEYKDRFLLGNDYISSVCLEKKSEIVNIESVKEKELLEHHETNNLVKSIIAAPLLLDDEVIAVVLCESKTLNFFGTPNIYTLQVFSESINNFIKYYSLNEDYVFEDSILGTVASGRLKDENEAYTAIKTVFDRYVVYDRLYLAVRNGEDYTVVKSYPDDESSPGLGYEGAIEQNSIAYSSAEEEKISVYDFGKESNGVFRFSKNENINSGPWFCCLPVIADEDCFGLVSFDAKSNIHINQKILSKLYKLLFPVFLFLINRQRAGEVLTGADSDALLNKDVFYARLETEMSKCRLFNENNLYCVNFCIDNTDLLKDEQEKIFDVEELLIEFLRDKLAGYDMIFKLGENRYALIADVCSEEKVFLEIEKIRKSLSAKIYNIEGKEINFTASFAIKRYDDMNMNREEYLKEIENLLDLAQTEGGNVIKI